MFLSRTHESLCDDSTRRTRPVNGTAIDDATSQRILYLSRVFYVVLSPSYTIKKQNQRAGSQVVARSGGERVAVPEHPYVNVYRATRLYSRKFSASDLYTCTSITERSHCSRVWFMCGRLFFIVPYFNLSFLWTEINISGSKKMKVKYSKSPVWVFTYIL